MCNLCDTYTGENHFGLIYVSNDDLGRRNVGISSGFVIIEFNGNEVYIMWKTRSVPFRFYAKIPVINDSLNVQGRIEGQRCNGPLAKILVHALLYALKERERTSVESWLYNPRCVCKLRVVGIDFPWVHIRERNGSDCHTYTRKCVYVND